MVIDESERLVISSHPYIKIRKPGGNIDHIGCRHVHSQIDLR